MTSRRLIETDPNTLELMAFNSGEQIHRIPSEERMYLRLGSTTYWAPSPAEVSVR